MTLNPLREQQLLAEIEKLKAENRLKRGLPHIYSFKWYTWAREFFESTNRINLLCAANQISKSSTNIRKCIHWATEKTLWPSLWNHEPNQFWYFYPSQKIVNTEYETKWKQFLPKNEFKNDPIYGWDVEKNGRDIVAIHFYSGIHLYFKTYSQKVEDLQAGTVDAMFCDEEMPFKLYSELIFRLTSSDGYFHMVFTATIGQDEWRRAMEIDSLGEDEEEFLPSAFKRCVSLYECQEYEDGSLSHWTDEKIKQVIARCATHNEVMRRVQGRFVINNDARKYPTFDYKRHMKEKHPVPKSWLIYGGADVGSGNAKKFATSKEESGHPAAIAFIAVNPNFRQGRVFLAWRGDGIITTAGDVVLKYQELVKEHKLQVTAQVYDWNAADFYTIATRIGLGFEKADKDHETGEEIVNTLFKNDMLAIYSDSETEKLAKEYMTLKRSTRKDNAKDDLIDCIRYICKKIPWDFTALSTALIEEFESVEKPMNQHQSEVAERRSRFIEGKSDSENELAAEFEEWNEQYGN